jgi:hypothetical protein
VENSGSKSGFFNKDERLKKDLINLFDFNRVLNNIKNERTYRIFFGWNEKDKITTSFFINFDTDKDKFFPISCETCLDNMVIETVKKTTDFEHEFKHNKKSMNFLVGLLYDAEKANKKLFSQEMKQNIENLKISKYLTGWKFTVINLLTISEYFPDFENFILEKILQFIIELESQIIFSNNKYHIKNEKNENLEILDFVLKCLLNYLRVQIKNIFKTNRDLYINKHTKTLKKIKKKLNPQKKDIYKRRENLIEFFFNFFLEKILRIEGSKCVQFIVLFVVKSNYRQKINSSFPDLEEYFIHQLLSMLYSKNKHDLLKEKALFYIYSYIKITPKSSGFLYTVIFYLYRYFRKITKKIIWKIKKDFKNLKFENFDQMNGKAKKHFLEMFNKGIFVKLLYFLMKILTENLQNFSTENLIDIIKNFENYFTTFWPYIKILIKNNKKSFEIFSELNKTLKNPLINDILTNDESIILPKQLLNNSISSINTPSKCSFSNYSKISISSYHSIKSDLYKNNWEFNPNFSMFDYVEMDFVREFFENVFGSKKNSIFNRKMSLDTDNSVLNTPVKKFKNNVFDFSPFQSLC